MRKKPDTSAGFYPRIRLDPEQVRLAEAILHLDGELGRASIHPAWAAREQSDVAVINSQSTTNLEGNPIDRQGASRLVERWSDERARRVNRDERDILNHYRFYNRLAKEGQPEPLRREHVQACHRELMAGVLSANHKPGQLRGTKEPAPVYFGDNEGTPYDRVDAELDALLQWYGGDGRLLPLPIRVSVWFHEFVSIHPFTDGNGRVGRALTHRLLLAGGLPHSIYVRMDEPFNQDRRAYFGALDEAREQDLRPWITYFLQTLHAAYEDAVERLDQMAALPEDLTGAQRAIMEHALHQAPTPLSRDVVAEATGYKPSTVSVAFLQLAKRGLLHWNGQRGRGSAYRVGGHA